MLVCKCIGISPKLMKGTMELNDHGHMLAKALPLFGEAMTRNPALAVSFTKLLTLWATPYVERQSLIEEIRQGPAPFKPAWELATTDEGRHSVSFIARAWDIFDPFGRYET